MNIPPDGVLLLVGVEGLLVTDTDLVQHAARAATRTVTGRDPGDLGPRAGRTCWDVAITALTATGRTPQEAHVLVPEHLAACYRELREEAIAAHPTFDPLPGAGDFLARARHAGATVGLCTGLSYQLALNLLSRTGLDEHVDWRVSAFGDDQPDRAQLIELARHRAGNGTHPRPADRTIVVSSHARGIHAARAAGVPAVVVTDARSLHMSLADLHLADLTDHAVIDQVLTLGRIGSGGVHDHDTLTTRARP
ncbi:haloacid dehalogenase [Longispora fulva]|uniref:Beta-phosphoglucomutase-like phosphatase (HAD superfamily) n=1 Tax=Longispora fulva TaxID=619741 RepID=A0A8J7KIH6_9ACTN|nr:HAD family phosphatase [Longispora fulva]MBG6133986.1 beta-phosphoglucomutase-like phosphatase (HAD superfamily) [Longispora fulva]GIG63587.1 haloacid dehalogenase [Longispora fulva]